MFYLSSKILISVSRRDGNSKKMTKKRYEETRSSLGYVHSLIRKNENHNI